MTPVTGILPDDVGFTAEPTAFFFPLSAGALASELETVLVVGGGIRGPVI